MAGRATPVSHDDPRDRHGAVTAFLFGFGGRARASFRMSGEERPRTAKACGPDARRLASRLAVVSRPTGRVHRSSARRRGQQCIAPRGERAISRKTVAQGRPGDRHHLWSPPRASSACGPWVPAGARPSPAPFVCDEGRNGQKNSGGICREIAKICLEMKWPPRAPDAAQRAASSRCGALLSRGPDCWSKVPALRSNAEGALQRVRNTSAAGVVHRPQVRLALR